MPFTATSSPEMPAPLMAIAIRAHDISALAIHASSTTVIEAFADANKLAACVTSEEKMVMTATEFIYAFWRIEIINYTDGSVCTAGFGDGCLYAATAITDTAIRGIKLGSHDMNGAMAKNVNIGRSGSIDVNDSM